MSASELDQVLSQLDGVRRSGDGWVARCPSHEDREPSLSVGEGDGGKLLLRCHAGCEWDALRSALGLSTTNGNGGASVEVARYTYSDEAGNELYHKVRFEPKRFIREPKGIPSSLYRLELLQHATESVLYLSESEKDADAVLGLGDTVAVSSGGASTWRDEWSRKIRQAHPRVVAVLEHNDEAGRKFSIRVAASLAKYGVPVRVLTFEGGEGYDVSDWLRDGADVDELFRRVESAPDWVPSSSGIGDGLALMTLGDLLSMPAETTSWVWEGRIPSGGLAGLFAKPKGGKSTLARCLSLAVARREPFLGFDTSGGAVIYLGLEEKPAEVQAHFKALGATPDDPIHVLIATAPADGLARLRRDIERLRPVLVIIDTISRLVRLRDGNDYAEVSRELEPVLAMARETGAAVLFLHHMGKGDRDEAGDAILGSTAIFAAVDTALMLKRTERYRTLASIQRYGTDLEEITLRLDPDTRAVSHGGTRERADEERYGEEILSALRAAGRPMTKDELFGEVEGRATDKLRALKGLVDAGTAFRSGNGKRGDPFLFSVTGDSIPPFPYKGRNGGMETVSAAKPLSSQETIPFPRSRVREGTESSPGTENPR